MNAKELLIRVDRSEKIQVMSSIESTRQTNDIPVLTCLDQSVIY